MTEVKVLDHGFVRLIDHMGSDNSIVQAARVSYGEGTKSVREDEALIRYLLKHSHTTPFEMVEFKFHCKMPIFIARQWVRHRTANINEYSARYSEMKDEYYVPNIIGVQSTTNKQGTEKPFNDKKIEDFKSHIISISEEAYKTYKYMLEQGVSREIARIVLPVNFYTEWYWKIDLHNLFHFLKLRLDNHAQWEIQQYAWAIAGIVKDICPIAWKAFEDYILYNNERGENGFNN